MAQHMGDACKLENHVWRPGPIYAAETFDQVGGFPNIPLMEDVEMSRALNKLANLSALIPVSELLHQAGVFRNMGRSANPCKMP